MALPVFAGDGEGRSAGGGRGEEGWGSIPIVHRQVDGNRETNAGIYMYLISYVHIDLSILKSSGIENKIETFTHKFFFIIFIFIFRFLFSFLELIHANLLSASTSRERIRAMTCRRGCGCAVARTTP